MLRFFIFIVGLFFLSIPIPPFGKPNRTLVPAPMVPEHEHRRRISNDRIILGFSVKAGKFR